MRKDPSYNRGMRTEADWIPALLLIGNCASRSTIPPQTCRESKRLHAGRGRHLNQHSTTKTPAVFFSHLSTKPAVEEPWINIARFLLFCFCSSNSQSTLIQRHHTSTNNTPKEAGNQHQQTSQDLFFFHQLRRTVLLTIVLFLSSQLSMVFPFDFRLCSNSTLLILLETLSIDFLLSIL